MKHKQEKKFYQDVIKQIEEVNDKIKKAQKSYEIITKAYNRVEQEYAKFGEMINDVKRIGTQQNHLVKHSVTLTGKYNALIDGLMTLQKRRPDIFEGLKLEILKDESIRTASEAPKDKPEHIPPKELIQQKPVELVQKVGHK